ncbi:Uncharacterised protein [Serratia rubidaea]|uniref:Uncharacterized protein n=1 Tax=Serratia rubidaea TaxID=61652 RepID=A0A447QPR6_SERRU|nr:Uncharacterised protein [Serratia rubidaea]
MIYFSALGMVSALGMTLAQTAHSLRTGRAPACSRKPGGCWATSRHGMVR